MVDLLQVSKSDWTRLSQFHDFKKLVRFFIHLPFGRQDRVQTDEKKFSLSNSSLKALRPKCLKMAEGQNVNEERL